MSKIKIAELFYSIQGEGRYMGVPSVFLRTFGCNFRCQGFGMPRGELSTEAEDIATVVHLYNKYEELPLVSTGCDSYASWHPLLGWQRVYPDLLDHPNMLALKELTFETNGTQALTDDFQRYLLKWQKSEGQLYARDVTFSVSAKLSNSGEKRQDAIRPDVLLQYQDVGYTYLKFVVATEDDAYEAIEVMDIYRLAGFTGAVYLMPVGGVESVYALNNRRVAELAMKAGLRYSDRLQVPLFKNEWGT